MASPTPEDLAYVTRVATQLVTIGGGDLRKVFLIGSRAVGDAQPDSDFDLLVVVEIPRTEKPWGFDDNMRARERFRSRLAPIAKRLDVSVRTTDAYAEACSVVGSVEWLVGIHGIELYSVPNKRLPVIRMNREAARRSFTVGWFRNSTEAYGRAVNGNYRTAGAIRISAEQQLAFTRLANKSFRCAINAVLVYHKIPSFKNDPINSVFAKLRSVEPGLTDKIEYLASVPSFGVREARLSIREVASVLERDSLVRKQIEPFKVVLAKPLVFAPLISY